MKTERRAYNGGFSLLEALFAIVVLMIGVLGVITMLDVSFTAGSASKNMTTATELAQDMLDRIRTEAMSTAQPWAADDTVLQTFTNSATDIVMDTSVAALPAGNPALADFNRWKSLVQALPNGRGVVTIQLNAAPGSNHLVTVQISWTGILRRGVVLQTILTRQIS